MHARSSCSSPHPHPLVSLPIHIYRPQQKWIHDTASSKRNSEETAISTHSLTQTRARTRAHARTHARGHHTRARATRGLSQRLAICLSARDDLGLGSVARSEKLAWLVSLPTLSLPSASHVTPARSRAHARTRTPHARSRSARVITETRHLPFCQRRPLHGVRGQE